MNRTDIKRALIVLAMGASTFAIFGGVSNFGPTDGLGCNYAALGDYDNMYQVAGDAVIDTISDTYFGAIGTDFDNVVRTPATNFAQAIWANWLDTRIPDDLPVNAVVAR